MLFVTKPDIFCIPCKLRVCKFPKNSMGVNDMYHCHPCHFLEIYKPLVNVPIGSYQIQHLKSAKTKSDLELKHDFGNLEGLN